MNRGFLIRDYLGMLRKHWIPVVVIAVLVAAGGYLFLSRQTPVYEATAKLKIIRRPQRRTASDVTFSFEEDQFFYNTQYNLLTTQLDWANEALDRAALLLLCRLDVDHERRPEGAGDACLAAAGRSLDAETLARVGGAIGEEDVKLLDELVSTSPLRRALDSVRERVVRGAWGFTPDAFLANVRAAPIPNTYLAQLTLRAGDPGVAVFLVNVYAELYRDVSREEREETLEKEIDYRLEQREAALSRHEVAKAALDAFRGKHHDKPELALDEPVNLAQQQAEEIATKLNALETDRILDREEGEDLVRVLRARGIEVRQSEDGLLTLATVVADGNGRGVERHLAADVQILGLPSVTASENVSLLRGRLRALEEERDRLRAEFTEESEEIQQIRKRVDAATEEFGAGVAAVIVAFLDARAREDRAVEELRDRLAKARKEARRLNELYSELAEYREDVADRRQELDTLDREFSALEKLQPDEAKANAGPLTIQNIVLERKARLVDARQVQPKTTLILLVTIVGAVFLSLGTAFVLEYLDDTIKSKDEFARLVGVPDLGFIPRIGEKEFERQELSVREKPQSVVAEAFRTVRTGILFSRRDEEIKSFLVTSAGPGEGKTTVSVNLAITMAEAGRGRVLLIDADLRKSRVHTALGVDNKVGLTNCLVGSETLEDAVQATAIENLFVLTSGPIPPNPAELLGGIRAGEILRSASESFARVILDTPPLVPVTDTCLLATQVDGVFLVVSVGKTSWRLIQRGKEALAAVGVTPSGAILNSMRARHQGYGYAPYYQTYRYGD